ncbi:MAG: chemotaxis protein CheA [Nitrospirae bacterium]|nr:chemotaxis protein CheA [Nitrospirota bacterium]
MENFEHLSESEFTELRMTFYSQAYETVENLRDMVLGLDACPGNQDLLKTLKRHIHTLKGDSNSLGLTGVGTLCHKMEDVLVRYTEWIEADENAVTELLLECADTLDRLLVESDSGRTGADITGILGRIDARLGTSFPEKFAEGTGDPLTEYQKLHIDNASGSGLKLFEVAVTFHPLCGEKTVAAMMVAEKLKKTGEIIRSLPDLDGGQIDSARSINILLASKADRAEIGKSAFIACIAEEVEVSDYRRTDGPAGDTRPVETSPLPGSAQQYRGQGGEILRIDAGKVDHIMNLIGELIIGRSIIDQATRDIGEGIASVEVSSRLRAANEHMEQTLSALQKGVMKMRMVPVYNAFRRFPKLVRELSAKRDKKVRIELIGSDTELDKGIVDALGEPLSHIIRNSIDHGIEAPPVRIASGKKEEGLIALRAYHEAASVVIEVSDDGRGIDCDKLRKMAVEKGLIGPEGSDSLSVDDTLDLVFLPGLTTAESLSETSGRGVGMDAVKTSVEGLKGSIEVESSEGVGTVIRLKLPLTLAVIKALLVEAGGTQYALPVSSVAEVTRISTDDLVNAGGTRALILRDRVISILSLNEIFSAEGGDDTKKIALILTMGDRKVGLLVDRVLGQQQIVMKNVEGNVAKSDLVAGASILGNGRVVLILDAPSIMKKAVADGKKRMAGA